MNIFYGALYFLAVPTTSMLLLVYALGNLHVTSWGTRESNKRGNKKKQGLEDEDDSCFCCGLFRFVNLIRVHRGIMKFNRSSKKQACLKCMN